MRVKIGDVTKIRTGKLDPNASSEEGQYPFFTCSREPLRISTYSYDCECVLVAGNGDLNVKYYNGKFDAYQRTYIIEDNSGGKLYMPYLYYFMEGYIEELRKQAIGGMIKYIKLGNLTNALIELPSIHKQRAIVDILEKIRNVIAMRNAEVNKLENLVRARFVEMFGDIRYEEKYQGIPLRRLCTTISGGTPSTKCSEYYEGNIPWISTVSLGPNYIDGSTAKGYITQEAIDNSATKLIPAGNILFGTRVGVGKSSINDVALCINQDIVAIVGIDKNRFNVLFIKYVLDTYQSYYDSIKKGATILGITGDDLKNTLIPVPPLELQNQFADFVKVVDKSKAAVQKALDQTQLLFDSLMQEYFG